jgi:hypothetical protein
MFDSNNLKICIMKRYKFIIIPFIAVLLGLTACEEYLNIPPDAGIDEAHVFGTYENFQYYQDKMPNMLVDFNRHGPRTNHSVGGECVGFGTNSCTYGNTGNYKTMLSSVGIYNSGPGSGRHYTGGIYDYVWEVARICNMSLQKLDEGFPAGATAEEKSWLRGQAYFFRAFYHYEYVW